MIKRPISVTIVAWVLIVMAVISVLSTITLLDNPMVTQLMQASPIPLSVQYLMSFAGLTMMLVAGIAILKGKNWARYLYVIWSAAGFLLAMVTSPMKLSMLPGLVFLVVVAFFLFRPKATAYFTQTSPVEDAPVV